MNETSIKRMKELGKKLREASRAYYQEDREIMPNVEYDALYDELSALEEETGIVLADSPTVNVGYEAVDQLPKEEHERPMLSLDKTKDREALREFVGDDGHFSSMFDFSALELTYGEHGWYDSKPVDFKRWREVLFASQKEMEGIGFKANIIENHDEPRGASRYLPEYAQNEMGKKMLATTSILLRGIPFIYQGQEIGMTNCHRNDISEYDDISTKDQYQVAIDAGCTKEEALACCYENSRDNARTPMQWSADENGGFSTHAPWLAVNPNYKEINVSEQEGRDSVLSYYKELITLRKSPEYEETFVYGNVEPVYEDTDTVFGFMRMGKENRQKILVAANYGKEAVSLPLPGTAKKLLLSNARRRKLADADHITLESLETAVVLLKA